MRQRIEDLGRLAVLIDRALKMDTFHLYHGRNKDFVDEFYTWDNDKQVEFLHNMIYSIDEVSDCLHECYSIAIGHDMINDENKNGW